MHDHDNQADVFPYGWYSSKQHSTRCHVETPGVYGPSYEFVWTAVLVNFSCFLRSLIYHFRESTDSGRISTNAAHLTFLNHTGHCRFWVNSTSLLMNRPFL
ncbi:hypothetical protein CDAR_25221 [Caerostris darwini]|uniref:Uncharacterized protein n=1 Tax=Caerostris darwini TaxID=1538125 RepID=A0AAV4PF83_9ARAC|nr:hypothetical protein CDAR_25221 [Caerostris darwini]